MAIRNDIRTDICCDPQSQQRLLFGLKTSKITPFQSRGKARSSESVRSILVAGPRIIRRARVRDLLTSIDCSQDNRLRCSPTLQDRFADLIHFWASVGRFSDGCLPFFCGPRAETHSPGSAFRRNGNSVATIGAVLLPRLPVFRGRSWNCA